MCAYFSNMYQYKDRMAYHEKKANPYRRSIEQSEFLMATCDQVHNQRGECSRGNLFPQYSRYLSLNNLSTTHDPNCRACKDFSTWMKLQATKYRDGVPPEDPKEPKDPFNHATYGDGLKHGCPLDREDLGRSSWNLLHSMAAYFPEKPSCTEQQEMKTFMNLFTKYFPCETCRDDFKERIARKPPVTTSQVEFSQWMCQMHNEVNEKIGKPQFDCSLHDQRWRDGFPDKSCDF